MSTLGSGKRHAACDECRTRKLKCSGELPLCDRCSRESLQCAYSLQKPMGRPRKRRRDESSDQHVPTLESDESQSGSNGAATTLPTDANGLVGSAHGREKENVSNWFREVLPVAYGNETSTTLDWLELEAIPDLNDLGAAPPDQALNSSCPCLSTMYLTLSTLQALPSFSFPAVILPLRSALVSSLQILRCPDCPRETFSGIQNVLTITSLLTAIAERYHRVLNGIDEEARRLGRSNLKKDFRIGDMSVETLHLHTGDLNCPMGFHVELEAEEWKKLAKKVIKTEVLGNGSSPTPLIRVVEEMEERQKQWHNGVHIVDPQREKLFGKCGDIGQNKDATCMRMVKQVRMMIDAMDWA